ncbi:TetR/AcrR family transcriptional regulator [Alkalimarinus alittae]|uniref:TetR/AcrR family transcriptional regulator n=1 Tax=Alkalimarinus alittae TaxID=2961619 RepID=A0ABY6MXA2_9ALTE|nr:TetR/AcrR family transcriptional regulator [Alkalimarinus alittae]UZE94449.1 TetR/AcrR family transcriptional regulator [Alkalimarinus alittae]
MKTRDRILHTTLELFNECGEPNVTTLQIADEMDISPGNLYYHFKNKTEILSELFDWYEREIGEILDVPETSLDVEDQWLFLHLIFEVIARYRFLYQDLVNVMSRHERLANKFKKIITKKTNASRLICQNLAEQGILNANPKEIDALCKSIVLTATYWISFSTVIDGEQSDDTLNQGVYQVMTLVLPYLREEERALLREVGESYL